MERGHIPYLSHGMVMQSAWAPGDPVRRRFVGGIKWNRKGNLPIATYCCETCGFLEQYADRS